MAEVTQKPKQNTEKTRIFAVLVLLVLALVGFSAYAYHSNHSKKSAVSAAKTPEKGMFNQSISNLEKFNLTGNKSGEGITFSKPREYKVAVNQKGQASFGDAAVVHGQQHAFIGALHVSSVSLTADQAKAIAKGYTDADKVKAKQTYAEEIAAITAFITPRVSSLYNFTISNPTKFTSGNIKANAFVFDVSAEPKAKQAAGSILENYKGKAVLALGSHAMYYFVIYNTTYNWDNNLDQFNNILQSLKIDQ